MKRLATSLSLSRSPYVNEPLRFFLCNGLATPIESKKGPRSIGFLSYPVNLLHQAKAMPSDTYFQLGSVPI